MAIPAMKDDTILEALRRLELLLGGGGTPVPISQDPGTAIMNAGESAVGGVDASCNLTLAANERLRLGGLVASYDDPLASGKVTLDIGATQYEVGYCHGSLVVDGADLPCAAGEDLLLNLAGGGGIVVGYVAIWGRIIDA